MSKLTALSVAKLSAPGRHGDGNGLYLLIGPGRSKSWVFRYKISGRERGMGLGPYPATSLAAARGKASECRSALIQGTDPLQRRDEKRHQAALSERRKVTFERCAEEYVAAFENTWKNSKHRIQWKSTLRNYAYPQIGNVPIASVDVPAVLSVLEPIWSRCPETASRLRGRIEAILDWAKVKKLREGENPARWKGNLDYVLPRKSKIRKVKHHTALDFQELPAFIKQIRDIRSISSLALQFLILTAARTTEVLLANWQESTSFRRRGRFLVNE